LGNISVLEDRLGFEDITQTVSIRKHRGETATRQRRASTPHRWPDEDLEIDTLVPRAQALSLAVLRRDY
jgi:hypothetical protein